MRIILLIFIVMVNVACGPVTKTEPTITLEQELALEALNTLQINIPGAHIYSTFPGIQHKFPLLDSSYQISSAEFQIALEEISSMYGTKLSAEEYDKLSSQAAKAQNSYLIKKSQNQDNSAVDNMPQGNDEDEKDIKIWVLPELLERRDVILIW